MKSIVLRFVLVLFAALLLGCGKKSESVAAQPGLTKVRLQTDWYPQPEHGGYYQALARRSPRASMPPRASRWKSCRADPMRR
jgi:hypothetical protein